MAPVPTYLVTLAYVVLVAAVIFGAILAVFAKSILRAAAALGVGSAALAFVFFFLGAPYAGVFELSVGAGLISVLFIIAISLIESLGEQRREP